MSETSDQDDRIYLPLDPIFHEVRLLHLQPSSNIDDQPDIVLETEELIKWWELDYEAISYCWSEATGTASLRLNGIQVTAPASAVKVLRHLRLRDTTRTLWLDAICINQNGRAEKEQQIPLMKDIYSRCRRTLVWLDDEDDEAALAQSTMHRLTFLIDRSDKQAPSYAEPYAGWPLNDAHAMKAARNLIERPWFKRTWVVQEVALAPSAICYCGRQEFSWDFVDGLMRWNSQQSSKPRWISAESAMMLVPYSRSLRVNDAIIPAGRRDLGNVSVCTRHLRASDPRDKVFGLLGVADPSLKVMHLLQVDYSKTPNEFFRDATRAAILEQGSFDVFEFGLEREALERLKHTDQDGHHVRLLQDAGLPTWAPRWDARTMDLNGPQFWPWTKESKPTGRQTENIVPLRPKDPDRLRLEGRHLDEIAVIVASIPTPNDVRDDAMRNPTIQFLRHCVKFFHGSSTPGGVKDFVASKCMRGILGREKDPDHQNIPAFDGQDDDVLLRYVTNCAQELIDSESDEEHLGDRSLPPRDDVFDAFSWIGELVVQTLLPRSYALLDALAEMYKNRCLFVTESGRIGNGPLSARANDSVAIMSGARFPWVLTPVSGKKVVEDEEPSLGQFTLSESAYVPGMMDEGIPVMEWARREGLPEVVVDIV